MFIWLKKLENNGNSNFPAPKSQYAISADYPVSHFVSLMADTTTYTSATSSNVCYCLFLEMQGSVLEKLGCSI
jgi:hypothetical protein